MFGLSVPELLIVMVVALIVLGPERLPKVARTIGKTMREVRKATGDFKGIVEEEFYKLDEETGRMPDRRPGALQPIQGAVPNVGIISDDGVPAVGAVPLAGTLDGTVPAGVAGAAAETVARGSDGTVPMVAAAETVARSADVGANESSVAGEPASRTPVR